MAVYGELGRYPMYVNRFTRIIKYWGKIVKADNKLISTLYKELCNKIGNGNGRNWAADIKTLLDSYGFSYIWLSQNEANLDNFHIVFKQRVYDVFVQSWNNNINTSSTLCSYKLFKPVFEYEKYLCLLPTKFRISMSRLRLSSHKLHIETGRYAQNRTERHERYCAICNKRDIEDEYHFICVCEAYQQLRAIYIKPYFFRNPSVYKFNQLMQCDNRTLLNLGKFIYGAFTMRNSLL